MPSEKLTQRLVDALPSTERTVLYFDQNLKGFGIYTTKSAKTYFIQARVNGKEVKRTIGKAALMKLDAARTEAKAILAQMAKGVDPEVEKRQAATLGLTLRQTFEQYKEGRQLKPRTIKCYDDLLKSYVSDWLDQPVSNITKELIALKHREIGTNHGENAANNLMRTVRSLYNFAYIMTNEQIPANPVLRLSQARQWYKVERRRTILKPHELKPWHDAVLKIENEVIRDYLLLTIFTGLRKQEGLQLKWSNVDMRDRSFTIPDTKNGRPHTLPMSTFLHQLFQQLHVRRTNEYVFPGPGVAGHLVEPKKQLDFIELQTKLAFNSIPDKKALAKKLEETPDDVMPGIKFCLHDLRRTFITIAESLDIPYAALKRLLNHSDGNDVTGGYLQITTDRLREPMERISTKMLELMGA
ncbi:integrase [Geomonas sp. Red276]